MQKVPIIGKKFRNAFTLVELLVVIAILGTLAALLWPALAGARNASERSTCASNLRQLAAANLAYAIDHGTFVPAAADIWTANARRWHGQRTSRTDPFDAATGPLSDYLGTDRRVRQCPSFRVRSPGFEAGCGGYGYNVRGVGSQAYRHGSYRGAGLGMPATAILSPARTVMFTDAAFLAGNALIEYSFAEAYFHVADTRPVESYRATPSIHFRHEGLANVVWVDGHISQEKMDHSTSTAFETAGLGWFGPKDNSLFAPD